MAVNHWPAERIDELAEACGIYNPAALENTVAAYNADVASGADSRFSNPRRRCD